MAEPEEEGKGRVRGTSFAAIVTLNSFQGPFLPTRLQRLRHDGF